MEQWQGESKVVEGNFLRPREEAKVRDHPLFLLDYFLYVNLFSKSIMSYLKSCY